MPNHFELSGPAFIGLLVRDVTIAAEFYEQKLGFRRDPINFPKAVAFLSYPIPFAVREPGPGEDLDNIPRPIRTPAVWFKTANSQMVYDSLVKDGITILKPLLEGRFGRQFTFQDLDGYAITIYDRDSDPTDRPRPIA